MKNLFLAIMILSISCTTRDDYFSLNNIAPILEITNENNTLYDKHIRDSVKLNTSFDAYYQIINENLKDKLTLNFNNKYDSIIITENKFSIVPKYVGTVFYEIFTKDSYEMKSNSYNLTLVVFKNLPPVSVSEVNIIENGLSEYEIEIDMSKSYDLDAKFGGKIINYEYKIQNNYLIQTPLSKIRYIFEDGGQKQIQLRVQDCNYDWSNYENIYINL